MAIINRKVRDFKDFNLLFTSHPVTGDVAKVSNENAIKASIRNLILTKNYERPFHPEIGCQVYSMLFENFTAVSSKIIEQSVKDVLSKFEPRARIIDVKISDDPDDNSLNITVEFSINNVERPLAVNVTLQRTR